MSLTPAAQHVSDYLREQHDLLQAINDLQRQKQRILIQGRILELEAVDAKLRPLRNELLKSQKKAKERFSIPKEDNQLAQRLESWIQSYPGLIRERISRQRDELKRELREFVQLNEATARLVDDALRWTQESVQLVINEHQQASSQGQGSLVEQNGQALRA